MTEQTLCRELEHCGIGDARRGEDLELIRDLEAGDVEIGAGDVLQVCTVSRRSSHGDELFCST